MFVWYRNTTKTVHTVKNKLTWRIKPFQGQSEQQLLSYDSWLTVSYSHPWHTYGWQYPQILSVGVSNLISSALFRYSSTDRKWLDIELRPQKAGFQQVSTV